jgi:hypothetical protein
MTTEFHYVLKRNVGTIGRPKLACAVCNFSPSGHVLTARHGLEGGSGYDKGLCNVHARGFQENEAISGEKLEQRRTEWLESRELDAN